MVTSGLIPTKRGKVDVGRRCSARCLICRSGGGPDQSLRHVDEIIRSLDAVKRRGNKGVDFAGGEPTLHPAMAEIIQRAQSMSLRACIVTNGLAPSKVKDLVRAGCREWVMSLHGLERQHDFIVNVEDGWSKILKTLDILAQADCTVRLRTALTTRGIQDLPGLAELVASSIRPALMEFFTFFPGDTDSSAHRRLTPRVFEAAPYLKEALELLKAHNVWAVVRDFPLCLMKGYEAHICNSPQAMFEPYCHDRAVSPKTTDAYLAHGRVLQKQRQAQEGPCADCGVRNVCGGAYRGHVSVHGTAELTAREEISDYPYFFRTDLEADILIPVFRPNEEVGGTLAEIYRKTIPPYNIIISSKEQSAARNRNYGLERSRSPYVIMCDDDITALPWGWNRTLIEILKAHGDVIAVSARLLDRKGRVGRNSANNYDLSRPLVTVKNIPTACCAFRSTDTRCDERYVRAGWEDTDFFLQMKEKHGGRIVIANDVRVVHLNEEKNEGGAGNVENQKLFHDKWKGHRLVMPFEEPDREEMRREIFSLTEDLNHRKAVQAIERFLSRFGDDVDMLILLARTLRKMKRPEKAVIPALKAAGLDPRNGEAVRELVETSYLIEEFGFVEGYARTMIKCHGEIPQLLYLLADSLFRQGKLEEARVLLETLRGTRPYLVAAADLAQRIDGALCASAA